MLVPQNSDLPLRQAIAVIPEHAPREPKATRKPSNSPRDRPLRMSRNLEKEANWIAKIKEIVLQ